jgi:hypothetical protein
MAISYKRQFSHKDWIDFVDSVVAGGTNGINIRMHAIEAEFDALSQVVAAINTALQGPPPAQRTLSLSPVLASVGAPPWLQELGAVGVPASGQPPAFAGSASGFMPVVLPNGATIQGLRVTGLSAGGFLQVFLNRALLTGGTPDSIVLAQNTFANVAAAAAFDLQANPQGSNTVVDNSQYKYFVSASLNNGNTTLAAGGTTLLAFQITYSA